MVISHDARVSIPASGENTDDTCRRLRAESVWVTAKPGRTIDPETERAARVFLRHLKQKYDPIDVLIFGSRARGDHNADSDTDIAVILRGEPGNRARVGMDMAGFAFDAMRESGVLVEALPIWENELACPEKFHTEALVENIKRDGLRL